MKIVTIEQMRRIEQECSRFGISTADLMENAGRAIARELTKCLAPLEQQRVLVLVGPGNNGGDGLVAARYLHAGGAQVTVFLPATRPPGDPNLKLVVEHGIPVIESLEQIDKSLETATTVLDAFFGTGTSRPLSGAFAGALRQVARAREKRRFCLAAVDVPSGLDADTGKVDPATPYADCTITLSFPKPGLFSFPGADRVGKLTVVDIGIPAQLAEGIELEMLSEEWIKASLPPRPIKAHKGTFGRVLAVVGSINYIGAAYLACMGAARVGAGLVTLATGRTLVPILGSKLTEVTFLPLPEAGLGAIAEEAAGAVREAMRTYDVLLLGCGLGQHESTARFVASFLEPEFSLPPAVLDADGLGIIARIPGCWQRISDAVLTPHPGEMARLTGLEISAIQSDRIGIAKKYAAEWNKTVVLKGAFSVIAAPDGRCRISPWANPGMASAGTGDVLAGAIAGLLAQGCSLFDAACLGSYLHGKAGQRAREKLGDAGMLASDLLAELPAAIKELKGGKCCSP